MLLLLLLHRCRSRFHARRHSVRTYTHTLHLRTCHMPRVCVTGPTGAGITITV